MTRILFMSEDEARSTLYCAGYTREYEIYVIGNVEKNQTIQYHPFCDKFVPLQAELAQGNGADVAAELLQVIESEKIDILMPISITCMKIVDDHKQLFSEKVLTTPFPSKENIDLLDDKFNFYKFCKDNDIAHPESVYAQAIDDIHADEPGVSYPLLIKPVLGAGGFDTLVFLKTADEMKAFLQKPREKTKGYFPALLQEFFEGEDIDFNGFSVNGVVKASSVMRTDFYEQDIELYFTSFVKDKAVLELGEKILQKSGYSGPTNIDMRIRKSDGKLMLIEVNPRFWARVPVSLMDGQNYLDVAIRDTLNKSINYPSRAGRGVWVSSISILLKSILKGKLGHLKYIFRFSGEQIKLMLFNRKFMKYANRMLAEK